MEFPRGKVIYESNRTLGYVRISPRADAVAFAEFLTADGDAGRAIAVDRNGKELVRSALFISLEGVAWPPSGKEVWVAATTTEGWRTPSRHLALTETARYSSPARTSSLARYIARWPASPIERIVEKRVTVPRTLRRKRT